MDTKEKNAIEEKFLHLLAQAYEMYEIGTTLPDLLAENMRYSSTWVMRDLYSKQEYLEYLTGKLNTMKKDHIENRFIMMHTIDDKPFLKVAQETKVGHIGFSCKCDDRGLICNLDIMPACFAIKASGAIPHNMTLITYANKFLK